MQNLCGRKFSECFRGRRKSSQNCVLLCAGGPCTIKKHNLDTSFGGFRASAHFLKIPGRTNFAQFSNRFQNSKKHGTVRANQFLKLCENGCHLGYRLVHNRAWTMECFGGYGGVASSCFHLIKGTFFES